MKNVLFKAILASSLVASAALAEGVFVGGETGYYNSEISNDLFSYNNGQVDLGLKAGYDWDSHRVYVGYSYGISFNKDTKLTVNEIHGGIQDKLVDATLNHKWREHRLVVGGDWTPSITENLKFSIGAYTGLAILDVKDELSVYLPEGMGVPPEVISGIENAVSRDKTYMGWVLGAKIGGIYEMSANSEIEFGMKIEKTDYENDTYNPSESLNALGIPLNASLSYDNSGERYGLYVGYNYKF